MNKNLWINAICCIALIAAGTASSHAFSSSKYAKTSRLSTGKWVKISIPEDGIYQITFQELAAMGFSNPQSVRIYGSGGHPIDEYLDGNAIDDLKQVPCKIYGNKLCFYGCGPVGYSINSTNNQYLRAINSYAQQGCYFLTCDDGTSRLEPITVTYGMGGTNIRTSSLDYLHYEKELTSPSESGKDMLGELLENGSITIPYSIKNLCGDSAIVVNPCLTAKCDELSYATMQVNGNDVAFNPTSSRIYGSTSIYVFYNSAAPSASFGGPGSNIVIPATGEFKFGVEMPTKPIKWGRLDYFLITYYHDNNLVDVPYNQLRMGFNNVTTSDILAINNASSTTQLWNIDNPNLPRNYNLNHVNNISGFKSPVSTDFTQFIAFDPSKELMKITSYENVENQNIHGMVTPDMVIVTCKELIPQAERIAQMHRDHDNMTVHVIDQEKIFNEFSSGTRDAMAIRLMNKMFYDRNSNKFKHALMFGAGTYDNRQLLTSHDCTILTYESTVSNDENNSYVSDDFFGMLEDNSGKNPASDLLLIGVGRIPCATIDEATADVDKLLNYVNNPDYGPWRNNALFVADYLSSDGNLHAIQTEGITNIISDELGLAFNKNKVYVSQFPVDPVTETSIEGRKSLNNQLVGGQYFMTYVGHANPNSLSKEVYLWNNNDAKTINNSRLPIVTAACCDVARYDGSQRGIMESMFHNPNGGAIAMVASTRSAYANGNDALNQAFVRAAFNYNSLGHMPTVGEAYKLCKQSFGQVTSYNKMMFILLGDPAMKLNYPKPLFKITKINGHSAGTNYVSSGQLQKVTVEAKVYKPNGTTVDQTFNGNATLTIYDYLRKEFTDANRDVYYPRQILTQVEGRVVNGTFTGIAVIPRFTLSPGASGLVSVYAHRDNSDEMVSGSYDKLVIKAYDSSNSLTVQDDNTPPVIEAIYFNDEEGFKLCNTVASGATLHIRATDDTSFAGQVSAIGNNMDLKIDNGKKSLVNVSSFATISNEGKMLNVSMPIIDLEPGEHTLQYTVYDASGNIATQCVNFAVSDNNQQLELTVEEEPAVSLATFNVDTDLDIIPEIHIKVFNHVGTIQWQTTTRNFPFTWDLKSSKGKRLPAGIYTFYGKYNNGTVYGGTTSGTLIIADEVKH